MQRPPRLRFVLVALPIVLFLSTAAGLLASSRAVQGQQQPIFRAGVVAVPIDVRVIDEAGRPITDLGQDDFTVFEDDVRQTVVHFSRQVLVAQPPGPALRARPDVPAFDASPQNHRVFLIVLGGGSLGTQPLISISPSGSVHGPATVMAAASKPIDGLVHLVRDRLLPQDQVALLAYNRATDFTADHEAMATLLEAFRTSEQNGVAKLARRGITSVAGPTDSVFSVSAAEDLGFAEYLQARNRQTTDLENVHYGIRYLRHMEGEKHLIYVTARGMVQPLPGTVLNQRPYWEDPKELAAAASDARVALHVIHTEGISASPNPAFLPPLAVMTPQIIVPGRAYWGGGGSGAVGSGSAGSDGAPRSGSPQPGWDRSLPDIAVPVPGTDATGLQALTDLRTVASLTGGHASIMADAGVAVDRIDEQTRVDYLLAYSPANATLDGRYRNIRVEVNRAGARVLFRHGYYARKQPPFERRAVVTAGRLAAAATSTREIRDIKLAVNTKLVKGGPDTDREMLVRLSIDGSRLGWATDDLSQHVVHLDIGIFCADAREKIVGQATRTVDVTLTEQRFAQLTAQGLPYSIRIPVKATPRYLKVIVYNYEANLLGSRIIETR